MVVAASDQSRPWAVSSFHIVSLKYLKPVVLKLGRVTSRVIVIKNRGPGWFEPRLIEAEECWAFVFLPSSPGWFCYLLACENYAFVISCH